LARRAAGRDGVGCRPAVAQAEPASVPRGARGARSGGAVVGLQLPLNIALLDGASFENYYPGPNRELLDCLVGGLDAGTQEIVYLWGRSGSGKTHLLRAQCRAASARGQPSAYLPLAEDLPVDMLDGLERMDLLCLDDIHARAGRSAWEHALFALYNRCRDAGVRLLISGKAPPGALGIQLPDLASRLSWGLVLRLRELAEADKVAALQHRAHCRGLELPAGVASFLLRRCRRDLAFLFGLLDRLDRASAAAQRRLTIPFVKGVLESVDL
jgi:DnaA family protein